MESIIRKRRLRRLGHVWRMDNDRRANQVLHWVSEGRKRRGRPRRNWTETVKNDLRGLDINYIMGEGGGAGNGQSRVEKMRCPMYRNEQDGLRSRVRFNTHYFKRV